MVQGWGEDAGRSCLSCSCKPLPTYPYLPEAAVFGSHSAGGGASPNMSSCQGHPHLLSLVPHAHLCPVVRHQESQIFLKLLEALFKNQVCCH